MSCGRFLCGCGNLSCGWLLCGGGLLCGCRLLFGGGLLCFFVVQKDGRVKLGECVPTQASVNIKVGVASISSQQSS